MIQTLVRKRNIAKFALLYLLVITQLVSRQATAQTTLVKGDIAVLGWNSNNVSGSDQFAFVTWVPLLNNTVIKFTNNRWHSAAASGNSLSASAGSTLNQIINWSNNTGSTIAAGTVILIQCASTTPTATVGTAAYNSQSNGSIMSLSNSGQRIFAYQGSDYGSAAGTDPATFGGTILFGLYYEGAAGGSPASWITTGSAGTTATYLPSELNVSGYNIVLASDAVGGQFTGARNNQSTFAAYQAIVANNANWTTVINPNTVAISTTAFTLAASNYYYDGSGDIATLTNWGTNTNGTGSNPANFTTTGATYFIANTAGTVNLSSNWTVGSSTGTLNIGSGIILGINGNTLNVTGAIAGSGTLAGSATSNLSLTGTVGTLNFTSGAANRTLHDLTLAASTTATLGTALAITGGSSAGTVSVGSGSTLTTGSNLTLSSDASGTARIGNSAGSVSGSVNIERYIPGKRAYRFLSHPFTTTQALTTLTDDIDITGSGGAGNGFTPTTTNNPSSFWFNPATADNATTGNNTGWTAFTHTNGAGANGWDQYEMIRVMVRGSKGEGLVGGSYTPSAVTIDMSGTVNQGTHAVTLTKGSGSNFVSCGNPFPSGVQMNTVAKGANIGANYYVWDATTGAAGGYITNQFTTSFILPSGSALTTTATANSLNTLTFEEADKSTGGAAVFKGTAQANLVELLISDSTIKWDRLLINFDNNGMDVEDNLDAIKLYNPGLDFFTLSKDVARLAIDVRPYADSSTIPLGLTAYDRYNKYVIKTGEFDIPAGTKLYLHDAYLGKTEEITTGFEYWFDVTADTNTQGNQRFAINMVGKPTTGVIEIEETAKMQLVPNPAQTEVKVSYSKLDGKAQVKLTSVTGQVVYSTTVEGTSGSVIVPLQNIPAGIYMVDLQGKNARFTKKLIKQ